MRTMKLLGLTFTALLAFGVIGVGSASALLFLTKLSPELFLILNLNSIASPALFQTASGRRIECASGLGDGLILNKTDVAEKILITFHECKSEGTPCLSAGEPSGLITSLELDALLITTLAGLYGIVLLAEKGNVAEFTCANGLQEGIVLGSVAGEFPASKGLMEVEKEESRLTFKHGTHFGEPGIKDYWTLERIVAPRLAVDLLGLISESNIEASFQGVFDIRVPARLRLCGKPG
jgi:hypothetical protein